MGDCDYPGWHTWLFGILDAACAQQMSDNDGAKRLTDVLELLQQYLPGSAINISRVGKKLPI
jgi:hypothetical protein